MHWEDVPTVMDAWVLKLAAPAYDLRQAAASVPISAGDIGYYLNADSGMAALHARGSHPLVVEDCLACKAAADHALGPSRVREPQLSYQELLDPDSRWVKVAYSTALRRAGEYLNFFPGQYPGGIPNAPSPLAAMLTSGLVGAGLGWGGGKLLSSLLPERYGKKLGRTGAIIGGLAGAAPGAIWGLTNRANNKSLLSGWPLDISPDESPPDNPGALLGAGMPLPSEAPHVHIPSYLEEAQRGLIGRGKRGSDALAEIQLGKRYTTAVQHFVKSAEMTMVDPSMADVNINHLGQTLWDTGATPNLAASTMSAMYAAQQLPDHRSRPGWATGGQLGQLAQNAVGDYTQGLLVGAAINAAIGTPYSAPAFGLGNAALGVLGSVIPRLFGG